MKMRKVKFILNGCDISFCAIAPEDMTLVELLRQCDRIKPHWCACGIKSDNFPDEWIELEFTHTDVFKVDKNCSCDILPQKNDPFSYKENPTGKEMEE